MKYRIVENKKHPEVWWTVEKFVKTGYGRWTKEKWKTIPRTIRTRDLEHNIAFEYRWKFNTIEDAQEFMKELLAEHAKTVIQEEDLGGSTPRDYPSASTISSWAVFLLFLMLIFSLNGMYK